jgi:hypothetical protein
MSARPLTAEQMQEAINAYQQKGSKGGAARLLGLPERTYAHRLAKAMEAGVSPKIEMPSFAIAGDEEEPAEEIIDRLTRNFERSKRAHDAKRWFTLKVKESLPIGVLMVGDPHVDDNGCNWPVLRKHADICRETDGIYAINIGDSANYWGGRLIKKYADQDTSVHTARKLVEWLLLDSGFKWILWLIGNHEHMGDAAPLLHEMNKRFGTQKVPMLDWEARFVLQFPNGEEFRVNAAHNFAGNSMWNPLHGPVKAAKFGDRLDVVVCGDKHHWAIAQWEQAEQGTSPLMIRLRGYKHLDDYARRLGKYEQEEGQSVLVIFDPHAKTQASRVMAFADVEAGAGYLSWLRERAA